MRPDAIAGHDGIADPAKKSDVYGVSMLPFGAGHDLVPAKPNEPTGLAQKESTGFRVLDQALRCKRFQLPHGCLLTANFLKLPASFRDHTSITVHHAKCSAVAGVRVQGIINRGFQ